MNSIKLAALLGLRSSLSTKPLGSERMRIQYALHCPYCSETRLWGGKPVVSNIMVWLWLDRVISLALQRVAWGMPALTRDTGNVTVFLSIRSSPQSRHRNGYSNITWTREDWSQKLHQTIQVENIFRVLGRRCFGFLAQRNLGTALHYSPPCPRFFGVFNLVTTTTASSGFPRWWFLQVFLRLSTSVHWVTYTA